MIFSKTLIKEIWNEKTLIRIMLNNKCGDISLAEEKVLDVGSGEIKGSYHKYFSNPAKVVFTTDMKVGKEGGFQLNFETDKLPFDNYEFDTVLAFNIFEHVYNYKHLIGEINRVTKKRGRLIGFVPFLVNYHPDPHDYFRYTNESLEKIFKESGYAKIRIEALGGGPFLVNYNNLVLSIPRIFRILFLPFYLLLDSIFLKLRPKARERYPIGYFFTAENK